MHWYVDFVGRQHAFHTGGGQNGNMEAFFFFSTSKQYEYYSDFQVCNEVMGRKMLFFGTFDFLSRAVNTGTCMDRHGNNGNVWTATLQDKPGTSLTLELCAAPTGNIPFTVSAIGQFNYQNFERTVEFFGYYPGLPSAQYFLLPEECTS